MSNAHSLFATATAAMALLIAQPATALSGAIFTTDANSTVVNGNNYADCCDVYLNGGPPANAPCGSAGLPDGEYYFQVTNPSGSVLLSSDAIDQRRFRVEDGLIVEYFGVSASCQHELGLGKCHQSVPGNISIQLMPYNPTPNPGGVYKVWVTPVNEYSPGAPQSKHGFRPSKSKTDNFKCQQAPIEPPPADTCKIVITKYNDLNANGCNDDEPPLDGVRFNVWITVDGQVSSTIVTSGDNGPGVAVITDVPQGAVIDVCEQIPCSDDPNCQWQQTEPNEYSEHAAFVDGQWCYWLMCEGDCGIIAIDFGNVCVETPSCAQGLAMWTGSDGKLMLKDADPTWRPVLNGLALRDSGGTNVDFGSGSFAGSYAKFRKWAKNTSSSNAAYALSRELAATRLNVLLNGLDGGASVIVSDDVAEQLDLPGNTLSIKSLIKRANASLKSSSVTTEPGPIREYQQTLTGVLAELNSNALQMVNDEAIAGY